MNGLEAMPRLSIVVATWNVAEKLDRCLASIKEQTFCDWELLISDGGSTDGTLDLIKKHKESIAWWQSRRDHGIYDAWNQAIVHAKGEYVCFLGADDAWTNEHSLETLFAAIGDGRYDLVTSQGRVKDPATKKTVECGSAWDFKRIGRRMIVCHPGLLHRRTLFRVHGLFDSSYRITGDLEFLLRLPPDIATLHVESVLVDIEAAGISRRNVLSRLREQRTALSSCPRYGSLRAYVIWLDKLWRYPVARLFRIPH